MKLSELRAHGITLNKIKAITGHSNPAIWGAKDEVPAKYEAMLEPHYQAALKAPCSDHNSDPIETEEPPKDLPRMMSGFGQFHTNEADPNKPNKLLKPYLTVTLDDVLTLVDTPQQCDKEEAQWLIPSSLPSRNFNHQEQQGSFWMLWGDLDNDKNNPDYHPPTLPNLETVIIDLLGGADYETYNSRGATVDMQKARILIPLSEPLSGAGFMLAQEVLNDKLEALSIKPDRATERAAQLCYLPNKGAFYGSHSKREGQSFNPLQAWTQEIAAKREKLETARLMLEQRKQAAAVKRAALTLPNNGNRTLSKEEAFKELMSAFNTAYTPHEWMVKAGYDQRGDSFRHKHSETGNYSATCQVNDAGELRVNTLSSADPLWTSGQGAHDAFSVYATLFHGGNNNAAANEAGNNLLAIGVVSWNKAKNIEWAKNQTEQANEIHPVDIDGLLNHSQTNIDCSTMPDYPDETTPDKPDKPSFKRVSLADVLTNPPQPQRYVWGDRIPFDECTLLAAHGGTGKSMFALQMAIHTATGREFLGLPTECVKTLFFSAEDSSETIRRRVGAICTAEDIDPVKVSENLTVLDATDAACLFREVAPKGTRFGAVSEHYSALKKIIGDEQLKFAIIDNASDVYGADPVNRQYVTQFIRALVRLLRGSAPSAPSECGAVLLLAHVNRVTAKAGSNQRDTEGYADSAAWHNAARSRLFLNAIDDNGGLLLEHLKNNFGLKQQPLELRFRSDGSSLYVPDAYQSDSNAGIKAEAQRNAIKALLALIREFYNRGDFISPHVRSPTNNTHAMLKNEPSYPFNNKFGKADCIAAVRTCERDGLLMRDVYKTLDRKERERLALTEKAVELLKWDSIVRDELQD